MGTVQRKRPRFGDVVEIVTPKGVAYAQYTHRHTEPPRYGALIRVLPGLHDARPKDFSALVRQPEQFSVFFPLGAAVHRGIVTIVAHEPIPEAARPFPLFRAGIKDPSGRVRTWWVWDGQREWRVGRLSEGQRDLPIRKVVNATMLIHLIVTRWSPRDEV